MRESKGSNPGGEMKVSFQEQADPRPVFLSGECQLRWRWRQLTFHDVSGAHWLAWQARLEGAGGGLDVGGSAVRGSLRAVRILAPACPLEDAGRRPRTCHYGGLGNGGAAGNRCVSYPSSNAGKYLRAHPLGPERW